MDRSQVTRRGRGDRKGARLAGLAALLAVLTISMAGCSGGPRPADGQGAASAGSKGWRPAAPDTLGPVVATVAGRRITRHDVDSLIATAPANMQANLREPEGYKEAINRIITEEVFYRAAEHENVEQDSAFRAEFERNRRLLMMRTYYDRKLKAAPDVSDSTLRAYYDQHPEEFTLAARARVRHIVLPSKSRAQQVRGALTKGAPWDATALKHSTDRATREKGGMIGWVTKESEIVPGVGKAKPLVEAAFAIPVDRVSQPIQIEKNWHLIKVEEREERTIQPFETVSERVRVRMRTERRESYSKELSDSLRQFYNATIFEDSIRAALTPSKTAGDYFKEAQAATNPVQRIELYRELITRFPQDSISVQAKFMIGFTYAEEMGEYDMARREFEEFLRVHPDVELAGSARWMLDNMDKPAPTLDEGAPPEGATNAPAPDGSPPGSSGGD